VSSHSTRSGAEQTGPAETRRCGGEAATAAIVPSETAAIDTAKKLTNLRSAPNVIMVDDAVLAQRAAKGDTFAFESIVERYQGMVFNVAVGMVKNDDDAADITQTVFLKVYTKLRTYNPNYRFFSWLYRITANECIDHLRKRKREAAVDGDLWEHTGAAWDSATESDRSELLQSALLRLKIEHRIVIVLKYFLELSYTEISDIVSIREKTVKSRLFTARHQLRDILVRQGQAR